MGEFHCVAVPLEGNGEALVVKGGENLAVVLLDASAFVQCMCCGISTTFRKPGGPPKSGAALCITERQHSISDARTHPQNSKRQNHAGWL